MINLAWYEYNKYSYKCEELVLGKRCRYMAWVDQVDIAGSVRVGFYCGQSCFKLEGGFESLKAAQDYAVLFFTRLQRLITDTH